MAGRWSRIRARPCSRRIGARRHKSVAINPRQSGDLTRPVGKLADELRAHREFKAIPAKLGHDDAGNERPPSTRLQPRSLPGARAHDVVCELLSVGIKPEL